jgi:hypothetical protein
MTPYEQGLVNDAKQAALDSSNSALALFDFIENKGLNAVASVAFVAVYEAHVEARIRLNDSLKKVGEYKLTMTRRGK